MTGYGKLVEERRIPSTSDCGIEYSVQRGLAVEVQ